VTPSPPLATSSQGVIQSISGVGARTSCGLRTAGEEMGKQSNVSGREFVLTAPIPRVMWSLCWPIALSNEVGVLAETLLLFWIGRLLGQTGLVVGSILRPIIMCVCWVFTSVTMGAGVLVSRSVGRRDSQAFRITAGSISLAMTMWAAACIVVVPLSPWLA